MLSFFVYEKRRPGVIFAYLHHFYHFCISREELIESNQQICDFYKRAAFEKQIYCEAL